MKKQFVKPQPIAMPAVAYTPRFCRPELFGACQCRRGFSEHVVA